LPVPARTGAPAADVALRPTYDSNLDAMFDQMRDQRVGPDGCLHRQDLDDRTQDSDSGLRD
jgi:hypothetical protein